MMPIDGSELSDDWGDIRQLSLPQKIEAVREARLLFGKKAAQRVWVELQLPKLNQEGGQRADKLPDDFRQFLDECVNFDGVGELPAKNLLEAFRHWAVERRRTLRSKAFVAKAIRSMGVQTRKSGSTIYLGCSLREVPDPLGEAQQSLFPVAPADTASSCGLGRPA